MRIMTTAGVLILCLISIICFGSADQIQDNSLWNGTWESEYYILVFLQDGENISGWYEPKVGYPYDPGVFSGELSDNGSIFSGTWRESGPFTYMLADDYQSISGTFGSERDMDAAEPELIPVIMNRTDQSFNSSLPWTGTFEGERFIITYSQNGIHVTGEYYPVPGIVDEPGVSEGVVSDDGRTLTGTWREEGNFSFTLSEDGMAFSGLYTIAQDLTAGYESWDGKRVIEGELRNYVPYGESVESP